MPSPLFVLLSNRFGNATINQDSEGRYCLNDLHKAAGEARKDQPTNWQRTANTQGLIQSLRNSSEMRISPISRTTGRSGGTYVVKELVYAYAMWISPAATGER